MAINPAQNISDKENVERKVRLAPNTFPYRLYKPETANVISSGKKDQFHPTTVGF